MRWKPAARCLTGSLLALTLACLPPPVDVTGDGVVDADDVAAVSACLGADPAEAVGCEPADVDRDGDVDLADQGLVVSYQEELLCNGAPICDRAYDRVAYATSHNAMSALDDGFDPLVANHTGSMRQQLVDGMRGLMLDTHYEAGGTWLCHSSCQLGGQDLGRIDLVEGLGWIRTFLEEHPAEVVTIIFEAYISETDTAAAFAASGLLEHAHVQVPGEPWPSLREMIRAGRRLVVLTDDSAASLPWHHYVWDFAFETDFDFSLFDEPLDVLVARLFGPEGCVDNRGDPGADLFILNHFITATAGSPILADLANHNPALTERAFLCGDIQDQIPNFVTVDFQDIGGVLDAVEALNGS